jgi:soluble lytic murein transglycosylase-like protein
MNKLISVLIVFGALNAHSEFEVARKYGLEPKLLRAICSVESDLNHKAINPNTFDFGIGQINDKTAKAFGIDVNRLLTDRAYSIEMTAKVLSDFKRMYGEREPDSWVCRYNVGTGILNPKRAYLCTVYLNKVLALTGDL